MPRPFPAIYEDVPQKDAPPVTKVFRQISVAPKYYITLDGDIFSTISEMLLTPHLTYNGYKYIWLATDTPGKYKRYYVHRLVYTTWRGETPMMIHHIDGNKTNNSLYNLEAISRDQHSYCHYGTPKPRSKVPKNPLNMIDRESLPEDVTPFTTYKHHQFKNVFWSKSQGRFYRKRWRCKSGKYAVIKRNVIPGGRRAFSYLRDLKNKTVTVRFDFKGEVGGEVQREELGWMHCY